MVLYVLLVWLCAVGSVTLVELAYLSLDKNAPGQGSTNTHLTEPALPVLTGLVFVFGTFVMGLVLAYWLEHRFQPIRKIYLKLQKKYPKWYQRLPADKRELIIALAISMLLCLVNFIPLMVYGFTFASWGILGGTLGLATGFLIIPTLRYRGVLLEDRPEQAPKAILTKVLPEYSSERALKIGQIYLRLLLPVFSLFCMLLLPLALELIHLSNLQASLLMLSLFVGVFLGWKANQDSHLQVEHFQYNLYQLSALALLASAFLIFGVCSENNLQLVLMSCFSGYLAGIY